MITFKKGKKCCIAIVREWSENSVREKAQWLPRSVQEEEEEVPGDRLLCSLWRRPW